jgi:hypothetical protein
MGQPLYACWRVKAHCIVASGAKVQKSALISAWQMWCHTNDVRSAGTAALAPFGAKLRAAVPSVRETRPEGPLPRKEFYTGITVATGLSAIPEDTKAA